MKSSRPESMTVLGSKPPNGASNMETPALGSIFGGDGGPEDKGGVMVCPELAFSVLSFFSSRRRSFLPVFCVTKYWHVMPFSEQRLQIGLSFEHLTLEAAQESQLSRNLTPDGAGIDPPFLMGHSWTASFSGPLLEAMVSLTVGDWARYISKGRWRDSSVKIFNCSLPQILSLFPPPGPRHCVIQA